MQRRIFGCFFWGGGWGRDGEIRVDCKMRDAHLRVVFISDLIMEMRIMRLQDY